MVSNYPLHRSKCSVVNESNLEASCAGVHKHLIQCVLKMIPLSRRQHFQAKINQTF